MKPRKGVNTSQKGWMDNPDNIQWDEQLGMVRRLGNKENTAQVVLDLVNQKIVRNTFQTEKTFDDVFEYFFSNYHEHIVRVMTQFAPDALNDIVTRIESKLTPAAEVVEATVVNEEVQAE